MNLTNVSKIPIKLLTATAVYIYFLKYCGRGWSVICDGFLDWICMYTVYVNNTLLLDWMLKYCNIKYWHVNQLNQWLLFMSFSNSSYVTTSSPVIEWRYINIKKCIQCFYLFVFRTTQTLLIKMLSAKIIWQCMVPGN